MRVCVCVSSHVFYISLFFLFAIKNTTHAHNFYNEPMKLLYLYKDEECCTVMCEIEQKKQRQ